MKNLIRSLVIYTFSAALCFLLISSYERQSQQVSFPNHPIAITDTDDAPDMPYQQGMITIKVKEGIVLRAPQDGAVAVDVPSLDAKIASYGINRLEKRFKHKPIPKNSGLPDLSRIYLVSFGAEFDAVEVSKAFGDDPNIEYAEPVPIYRLTEVPNDPMYNQQQHLPQIKAEEAWEIHKGEDGEEEVVVAIIDTGVDWQHEDLSENCWQNAGEDADGDGVTLEFDGSEWILDPDDLNGVDDDGNGYVDDLIGWAYYNWIVNGNGSNPGDVLDPSNQYYGHGTHVGSIAAGCTNNSTGVSSISWNVKYMPVAVCNAYANVVWGFDGIIYAAENGADVINNSWGGYPYSQAHAEVITYARGLGSIVVCAAGNDADDHIFYPASYPQVVSVASVSQNDVKSWYSNYGACVDIAAPGGGWEGGIKSAIPGDQYGLMSGTSMASPLAAGLLALVRSYHPDWTADEVIAQVMYTSDNLDTINPQYASRLGYGRINAYRALALGNVTIPQELEFGLLSYNVEDNDGNNILEPGDTVYADFVIRNFSPFVGDDDVEFILYTDDPDLTLISPPFQADVEPDGTVVLENVMGFVISADAQHHQASLSLQITSGLPVIAGDEFTMKLAIAPSGILIWDEADKDRNMSGEYMLQFSQQLGLDASYTNSLPLNLEGYESVFVSLENPGINIDQSIMSNKHLAILRDYIISGGNIYVESGSFFLILYNLYPTFYNSMASYFGVQSVNCPIAVNQVNSLIGLDGTLMEGMDFLSSNQQYNYIVDAITPSSTGTCAFAEPGYGNVSVYKEGTNHKAFYLGYSLVEMEDVDKSSSRYQLLMNVLDFFGTEIPDDFLVANFKADNRAGSGPLEVSFTDLSLLDENVEITSWAWDFNADGTIDSNEENPVFTYEEPGHYDVELIITSDDDADTLVMEDYIHVNQGVLVYEMREGKRNFSGSYIYDFLIDNGIEAEYATSLPLSFLGYDAVFLSQGVFSYLNSTTPDGIVPPLVEYLQSGGNVYLEGADALGHDLQFNQEILPYFGLSSASDGFYNPLDNLAGQAGTLAEGLLFEYSNQPIYGNQDTYNTLSGAQIALKEDGIYPVAVQFAGNTHKTFCFSYALAELADSEDGTREELLTAILNFFGFVISGQEESSAVPQRLAVYPNPFNGNCSIEYSLQQKGMINLSVYDITGRMVESLLSENSKEGTHRITWDASTLDDGIYFIKLNTNKKTTTHKVIHLNVE